MYVKNVARIILSTTDMQEILRYVKLAGHEAVMPSPTQGYTYESEYFNYYQVSINNEIQLVALDSRPTLFKADSSFNMYNSVFKDVILVLILLAIGSGEGTECESLLSTESLQYWMQMCSVSHPTRVVATSSGVHNTHNTLILPQY